MNANFGVEPSEEDRMRDSKARPFLETNWAVLFTTARISGGGTITSEEGDEFIVVEGFMGGVRAVEIVGLVGKWNYGYLAGMSEEG